MGREEEPWATNQMWGLSPVGPGLQILPSSQGSQAAPVREKMATWKDTTNSDLKGLSRIPHQRSKTTFNLVLSQNYLQQHTQIKKCYFNIQLTHQGPRAACVSHGTRGPTEGQLEEREGQKR